MSYLWYVKRIDKIKTVIQLPFVAVGCTLVAILDTEHALILLKRWMRKRKS